ncbi:hypothetical protein ACTI_84720 [Actinoplanes sp. OR16]|uniref:hypothetical protein n=1 Tax=Actinoplanes sp. OR16 TaxID=946334 RepID=UPI000F70404D|nr:hypothetical protein [Actinoplanes sp. OR16]BBH71787.1 hypothetical protein ACTI_84720 [Actinoplanes sp. OR16]
MVNTVYLYPWDVIGDPHTADRVAALGVTRVALAASYHAVRAATPRHPRHRIVHAPRSAFHLPIRDVWKGIVPRSAKAWTGHDDSFIAARDMLRSRGLAVDAWVVVTHTDAAAGFAMRNAFGDPYPYAVCCAFPEVRNYARTLVSEVVALGEPDGLILEACGPMGFGHQSAHEKTAGADWTAADERLLSICFCDACAVPATLRRTVADAVGSGSFVADEVAAELLEIRSASTAALQRDVIDAARAGGVRRLGMFADADPWSTGPSAFLSTSAVDFCIAAAWDGSPARVSALRSAFTGSVGAYVSILPPFTASAAVWRSLDADELHIYHAGLASDARLDALSAVLRELS